MRHLTCTALIASIFGCQSEKLANETAVAAHRQLMTTTEQMDHKIRAENRYFDDIARLITESSTRSRSVDLDLFVTQHSREFVTDRDAADVNTPEVEELMRRAANEWAQADQSRQDLMASIRNEMRDGRQKLELARSEIKRLDNNLLVLAKSRDKRELFKFLTEYAKAAKAEYDKIAAEAEKLRPESTSPSAPSPATPQGNLN
jgi:hypothetical protein